jgi:hypothetical protein
MHTDVRYDYALMEPRLPGPVDTSLAEADIDVDTRLGMYRKLHELRQFGKRAHDLFLQNLVKGTTHLSLGMEAVATGFGAAMRPTTSPSPPTAATPIRWPGAWSWGRPWRSCWAGRTGFSAARVARCTSPTSRRG